MPAHSDHPLAELTAAVSALEPLSVRQRRLAGFLVSRYTEAAFMTARELGEAVGLSESSVVRFSQRLGFRRFHDLTRLLEAAVNRRLATTARLAEAGGPEGAAHHSPLRSVVEADARNLLSVLDENPADRFQQAVDLLAGAPEIYVVGLRSAECVAAFLCFGLGLVRPDAHLVRVSESDVLELVSRAGPGSVVIGISVLRYTRRTMEALELAGGRGARRIALTDGCSSPLAARAEHVLYARSSIPSFIDSFVPCLSLANALVTAVGLERQEATRRRLEELEQLWLEHRVYYRPE